MLKYRTILILARAILLLNKIQILSSLKAIMRQTIDSLANERRSLANELHKVFSNISRIV